jgi:quinone-modifying oxidoreductase, subunit QmoC
MTTPVTPSASFRKDLQDRGGASALRCYQCATCSSVCELAPAGAPFPRRQMLQAQWGLEDNLLADPAPWLCHQCNECTTRCPRDARPGDVMQNIRALLIERLAVPSFLGKLVARSKTTWPILLGVPFLFWVALVALTRGLHLPTEEVFAYHNFVHHELIYAVYFSTTAFVLFAIGSSSLRFWNMLGKSAPRSGSPISELIPVLMEIATHKRFGDCKTQSNRRIGHFLLLWGFVGAATASGLLVVVLYVLHGELPLPLAHPAKLLGNLAAIFLVGGGALLLYNRYYGDIERSGASTSFDSFFLVLVLLVVFTGCVTEVARLADLRAFGCWTYLLHLGVVLCLFLTFPFSKFAHLAYRTVAMLHERMAK